MITLTLGEFITLFVALGSLVSMYVLISNRITKVETKQEMYESLRLSSVSKLSDIDTKLQEILERITKIETQQTL